MMIVVYNYGIWLCGSAVSLSFHSLEKSKGLKCLLPSFITTINERVILTHYTLFSIPSLGSCRSTVSLMLSNLLPPVSLRAIPSYHAGHYWFSNMGNKSKTVAKKVCLQFVLKWRSMGFPTIKCGSYKMIYNFINITYFHQHMWSVTF